MSKKAVYTSAMPLKDGLLWKDKIILWKIDDEGKTTLEISEENIRISTFFVNQGITGQHVVPKKINCNCDPKWSQSIQHAKVLLSVNGFWVEKHSFFFLHLSE